MIKKWLVAYEKEGETLYFSESDQGNGPVWAAYGCFVADDGTVIKSTIVPVHFSREDAETLAFNYITFEKKYMGLVTAVECPIKGCDECGTS